MKRKVECYERHESCSFILYVTDYLPDVYSCLCSLSRHVGSLAVVAMFWKFDLHTTSHIDQLLDREDVTLKELMEEEDLLQECKAQNHRLLLFLSQDHCMHELVSLITEEPSSDLEERTRFK